MPTPNLTCFWCDTLLQQKGGGAIAIHFKCPNGCGAWWPDEDRTDESAIKLWNSEQAYKKSMIKAGSGGGDKGPKRKNEKKGTKVWLDE